MKTAKKKCIKLDDEMIDKIRKVFADAKTYLDDKSLEKLELSLVRQFPELSFNEETFNQNRLPQ